jgi:hypothetical protein
MSGQSDHLPVEPRTTQRIAIETRPKSPPKPLALEKTKTVVLPEKVPPAALPKANEEDDVVFF